MPARRHRPEPLAPLDPPMLPFMLAGTVAWAIVGLVLLGTDAPAHWRWTCLAGVLIGMVALPLMAIRDRRHRQRRAPGR